VWTTAKCGSPPPRRDGNGLIVDGGGTLEYHALSLEWWLPFSPHSTPSWSAGQKGWDDANAFVELVASCDNNDTTIICQEQCHLRAHKMSVKRVIARATHHQSLDLLYSKVVKICTYISIYFSYVFVPTTKYSPYKTNDLTLRAYKRYPTTFTIRNGFFTVRVLRLSAKNTVRF
jgi:hypothetical protein